VLVISLAVAAHQGWSCNLLTFPSDMFPSNAVASVGSLGTFAGTTSGAIIATVTGLLLKATGNYVPLFIFAGSTYLCTWCLIQLLTPRLKPVTQP